MKGAGIRSGQKVLEVGPGMGFFIAPATELVGDEDRVVAIDPRPLAIKQVASKIREAVEPRPGPVRASPCKQGGFQMSHEMPKCKITHRRLHGLVQAGGL